MHRYNEHFASSSSQGVTLMQVTSSDVLTFWRDAGYQKWFARNDTFDAEFRDLFLAVHFVAARRELEDWMDHAEGALALVILLDQLPRNVFRKSAHAYATDSLARHYAGRAVDIGFDGSVDPALRVFFYLPFEHSEDIADQRRSLELTSVLDETYMKYAQLHHDAIMQFGRFPHRNRELGRNTTAEEQVYLDAGGGFAG